MLSDGELSAPDEWEEGVELVAGMGIQIHTVAFGTTTPQGMQVYDLEDVYDDRKDNREDRRDDLRDRR